MGNFDSIAVDDRDVTSTLAGSEVLCSSGVVSVVWPRADVDFIDTVDCEDNAELWGVLTETNVVSTGTGVVAVDVWNIVCVLCSAVVGRVVVAEATDDTFCSVTRSELVASLESVE